MKNDKLDGSTLAKKYLGQSIFYFLLFAFARSLLRKMTSLSVATGHADMWADLQKKEHNFYNPPEEVSTDNDDDENNQNYQ